MIIAKIYGWGLIILFAAVLVNGAAAWIGLPSWYDFFRTAGELGVRRAAGQAGVAGMVFLLLVYPFLLGTAAYLAYKCLKLL
jgi:hypothetical protein